MKVPLSCFILALQLKRYGRRLAAPAAAVCLFAVPGSLFARQTSSTETVNTLADTDNPGVAANCQTGNNNTCTLRDAVAAAVSGDTINFSVTGTIALNTPVLLASNVTIQGPGNGQIVLTNGSSGQGVFYISNVTAILSGLSFANSNIINGSSVIGISDANVQLTNDVFTNNQSTNSGNGATINNNGGSNLTVTGCAFTGNVAPFGGAIYSFGTLAVNSSTFTNNTAPGYNGGAIDVEGSTTTVTGSTFTGNSSPYGGAIFVDGQTSGSPTVLNVVNSTLIGNHGTWGGEAVNAAAVNSYTQGVELNITNSTITGNVSGQYAQAAVDSSGMMTIVNTILTGNTSGDCLDNSGMNSCPANGVNGNVYGIGSMGLTALGNYGGPTQTILPLPGSAAVCAGLASQVPPGVTTDQRGWPLSLTPSVCPAGMVDSGAVQTNYFLVNTLADSLNGTDVTNCSDGTESATNTCSLRDALTQANTATRADVGFAQSLFTSGTPPVSTPGMVTLASALPLLTGQLNLVGPGANLLTVSGNNSTAVGSVLTFSPAAVSTVYGVTIAKGAVDGSVALHGGGAIASQGVLTVANSAFTGNHAVSISGGAIVNGGTMTIVDDTFTGNSADHYGGGFFNCCVSTATVINSTFEGNTAAEGGGGIENFANLTVADSTIVGNTATTGTGGGIGGSNGSPVLTMTNSIVAGNSTNGTANSGDCNNCGTQSSYNQIGLPVGVNNINRILGAVAYSPATAGVKTMLPVPGASSLQCMGSLSLLPANVTTDERGFPMNPTCATGSIDLGAAQTHYTNITVVQQPPALVAMGATISPPVLVDAVETNALTAAEDEAGGVPISVTLLNTGTSLDATANLSGTTTVYTGPTTTSTGSSVVAANFGDLSVSALGTYDLLPSTQGGSISTSTNSFTVYDANTVTQLTFAPGPPTPVAAGGNAGAVNVTEANAGGGAVAGASDLITLTVTGPPNYSKTYTATASNGVASFNLSSVTLTMAGYYTYTASTSSLSVQAAETVTALTTPASLTVTGFPTTAYAGAPESASIEAVDMYGNVVTGYSGTATVGTSDPAAVVTGSPVTLTAGQGVVMVTFNTISAQTQSITASSTSGLTAGSETGITVKAIPSFVVTATGDTDNGNDADTVCPDQNLGNNPGTSCTLRDALTAAGIAGAGNITFSPTVFGSATTIALTPNDESGNFGTLYMGPNISITGPTVPGGAPDVRTAPTGNTILNPAPVTNLVTIDGGNQSTLLFGVGGKESLADLNFAHGGPNTQGVGGVTIYDATVSISHCNFTGNHGLIAGALGLEYDATTVTDSTFSNNTTVGIDSSGSSSWGDGASIFNLSPQSFARLAAAGGIKPLNLLGNAGAPAGKQTQKLLARAMGFFYQLSPQLVVSNSTFTSNSGSGSGGIYNFGSLTVTGSTFSGNMSSESNNYADGSALVNDVFEPSGGGSAARAMAKHGKDQYNMQAGSPSSSSRHARSQTAKANYFPLPITPGSSPAIITNSTFTNNSGVYSGAVYNWGQMTINGGSFTNNSATSGAGAVSGDYYYGDVNQDDGYLTLAGVTLKQNSSTYAGAVLNVDESYMTVTGSTFDSNSTVIGSIDFDSGAILTFYDGQTELANDTFYGNSSPTQSGAGAVLNAYGGETDAYGITVTGNSGFLGGIYDHGDSCADQICVYLFNSIVSGNASTDPNAANNSITGDDNGFTYDATMGDVVGSSAVNLAPLGNYGGTTSTMIPLPASSAICAGSAAILATVTHNAGVTLTTDQRGDPITNTTYPGFSTQTPCLDAGAVQTHYALSFSTEPPSAVAPNTAFAAGVTLNESGVPFQTPVNVPLSLNGPGSLIGGAVTTTAGVASYSNLQVSAGGTGDTLTANLALNPALTPPLTLTANSTPFDVGGDFTIVVSGPTSGTLVPGSTVSYQVTVTPQFGSYAGPVTFTVTGLPQGATVTFSPSSISAGGGTRTIMVIIQMPLTAAHLTPQQPAPSGRRGAPWALALLLLPLAGARRLRRYGRGLRGFTILLALAAAGLIAGLSGCGNNIGFFAHPPQAYTVTITATSGSYHHSTTFTLNVE